MANTNKFSSIQIGLASPEKIRESLYHLSIGNVVVENIRKLDIKVLFVIDVV